MLGSAATRLVNGVAVANEKKMLYCDRHRTVPVVETGTRVQLISALFIYRSVSVILERTPSGGNVREQATENRASETTQMVCVAIADLRSW
eukprot:COSAG02_NODE_7065_length_3201_cov_2.020954_2_plen_91_part_00